jgi:Fe-S-cluster containining protein
MPDGIPDMVPMLTRALGHFLASLDAAAQARVLAAVLREAEALGTLPPGPERARTVHRKVDAAVAPFAKRRPEAMAAVRCRRGCSHCCRIRVEVTADEAELLAERVRAGLAHPDRRRLDLQRTWSTAAAFQGRPRSEADCLLLGADGACTVYEDRPSACRALLVASDPELCREADQATRVVAVINPHLELVVSAARTLDAARGNRLDWMAAGIARALNLS